MGKQQEDRDDVIIIAESFIRFARMPWDEYKAHIAEHPEDSLHSLQMPDRKGHRPIGRDAALAFARLAKRHAATDPDGEAVDLQKLDEALRAAFVEFFVVQLKPYDEQKWLDRMLNRATRNVKSKYAQHTHYLPCIAISKPHPDEFRIGRVRFISKDKFFADYGDKIKADHEANNDERAVRLERLIAEGKYRPQDKRSDQEAERFDQIELDWINNYYGEFDWVAEVTVPPCSSKISRERAETTVRAALDVLKLFFGFRAGKGLRLGHDRAPVDRTAHLIRGIDGIFHHSLSRIGSEGIFTDDGWYDGIRHNMPWALEAAGSAIAAHLSPGKPKSLHRDRWLDALHWYGQAVSEQLPAAQLVKYVAALERLTVLEESKTNKPGGQGVTDVVTRRTALLAWVTDDPADLARMRQEARILYDWRSSLMHGRRSPLTKEVLDVMHLAHRITQRAMFSALAIYVQLDMDGKVEPKDLEARFVEIEVNAHLSQSHHDYSFADYLALERDSEIKHEFDAGEILAMSGETARHSALAVRMIVALGNTCAPGCTVFTSDMRVRVVATGRATYPDVSMVCGPIEYDPEDAARTTITNPALLVEVLSVTTEKGDRGNKWMHYQRISSLQEYILVGQEARVEIFRRTSSGTWEYFEVREGTVRLASGPTLDLAVLYADLPL